MKLLLRSVCTVLLLALVILPLGGCPSAMDPDAVRDGSSFRRQITNKFRSKYDVEFSEENLPVVSVSYQTEDGTGKTATFQLDGYNADAKIGYKLVLQEDVSRWNEMRESGDAEAPDIGDEDLIQKACLEYEFPVIFLSAYQYQDKTGNRALKALDEFVARLDALMDSDEIKQWADSLPQGD